MWFTILIKNIKTIALLMLLLIGVGVFVFGCTPQKRLNRLVKNNPELIKHDTTYKTETINVPGVKIDTTFNASTNTDGLAQILNTYKTQIDSLTRLKLNTEIGAYIINRPCIDKPVTIHLKNGAWCTVSQNAGVFSFNYVDPPKKYSIKVPVVVMNVSPVNKYSWQMFAGGTVFGWFLLFLVIQFLKPKRNG